jgi:hypothetical protein
MAITIERRLEIINRIWTLSEAVEAYQDLKQLETTGQWGDPTPKWASEMGEAMGSGIGSVILTAYRKITQTFAGALNV